MAHRVCARARRTTSARPLQAISSTHAGRHPRFVQTAKIFITGRSQAARLPLEYRFDEKEVYIRRDPATGDVILSRRPESWDSFFALDETAAVPADFMTEADRNQGEHASRDPLGDAASQ